MNIMTEPYHPNIYCCYVKGRRSQWPHGLRRRSSAARLLRLWVRIPPGAWMFVCCECCVFSGRGLCGGLITRPEESYRLWRVVVCDQETSNEEAVENTTERDVTPRKQTNNRSVYSDGQWMMNSKGMWAVLSLAGEAYSHDRVMKR